MSPTAIFWYRRDLRLNDVHGLYQALKQHESVLLIFIFDPEILDCLPKDDARVDFIYHRLKDLNIALSKHRTAIHTFYASAKEVFTSIIKQHNIKAVYTNHDYEPYAIKRDAEIEALLNDQKITFTSYKDQVIFEKNEVTKDDGLPYKVYTPYSKKWLSLFSDKQTQAYPSEEFLDNAAKLEVPQWVEKKDMGFVSPKTKIVPYKIEDELIDAYEEKRNTPSVDGTSRLGPHLRFGTVSIRSIVKKSRNSQNITCLKVLIWREFFMQILWHFPYIVSKSFFGGTDWRS